MSEDDTNKQMKDARSKEARAAIASFDTLLWQGECKYVHHIEQDHESESLTILDWIQRPGKRVDSRRRYQL